MNLLKRRNTKLITSILLSLQMFIGAVTAEVYCPNAKSYDEFMSDKQYLDVKINSQSTKNSCTEKLHAPKIIQLSELVLYSYGFRKSKQSKAGLVIWIEGGTINNLDQCWYDMKFDFNAKCEAEEGVNLSYGITPMARGLNIKESDFRNAVEEQLIETLKIFFEEGPLNKKANPK